MRGTFGRSRFALRQARAFGQADSEHFRWQTEPSYFARTERELLDGIAVGPGDAFLEVGCGEGGNLVHLAHAGAAGPRLRVGLDLFPAKLGFARDRQVPAAFVVGAAQALPFRSGSFDVVLCRDVLHHLEDPATAVAELARVIRSGGRVWILEPNGRNPLVVLFALLVPHERRQLGTTVASFRRLVGAAFPAVEIEARQPLPVARALLHPRYGWPRLGTWRHGVAALDGWERIAARAWPRRWWAYLVARCAR